MNILIIHEINWVTKVVYELQVLSELLSLRGHNVYAIDYEYGNLHTKYRTVARAYERASVNLISPPSVKVPMLSRLSAFFSHYYAIEKTIRDKKIDMIILYSVPTNGLQTLYLAHKYRVPVIFRSIDVLHKLVSNPLLSRITYLLEKKIYHEVDLILTICPELSKYVVSMGANSNRVKVLPLGVDMNEYKPDADNVELRRKWGLSKTDKVIMFVGTLPRFSGLDRYLHQFRMIVRAVPEAKLVIVGDGIQRQELAKIVLELGLSKNVVFTGLQPYETMPQYINMSDICVNTFGVNGATTSIFPTKMIQYLACGKPVIAYPLLGIKSMIDGEEQGVVYAKDPDWMTNKTVQVLKSEKYRERLSDNAVDYVKARHDYDRIMEQVEREIEKLIEEGV